MSVPAPPVTLGTGGCAAIYNDTLYTFQSNAFQTLPLQPGAQWQQHPMGVGVDGARCVVGTQQGQDVLFIVGGQSNASQANFSGLQRWDFVDKSWQTINFGAPSVVQNRVNHGAVFLNDSASILVYSGYQDNSGTDTSQTFTISTASPDVAQSYVSNRAPPGKAPILISWNSSHAVMAGGDATNTEVWTFGIADGWHQVPTVLPSALPNLSLAQASLLQGDNGSKILEVFDLSKSPNTVTDLLLQPAAGSTQKRDNSNQAIDLTSQPAYNSTFAPKTTRSGFSLAQSSNGLVVIAGGVPGTADSVALFNQTANTWIDAGNFFNPSKPSPTAAATNAATNAAAPATSTPSAGAPSSPDYTRLILGAVLGSIFGAIALGMIVFLLLIYSGKYRRGSRKQRPADANMEKDVNTYSASSNESGNHTAAWVDATGPTNHYFSQRELTLPADDEPPQESPGVYMSGAQGDRSDQGWSQYFAGDVRGTSNQSSPEGDHARLTHYTEQSDYTSTTGGPHISAEVAPLHIPNDGQSARDTFLEESHDSHVSPLEESWDPIGASDGRSTYDARPPSSVYDTGSARESSAAQHSSESGPLPSFPGVPASRSPRVVPPSGHNERGLRASIVQPNGESDRGMRSTMASRDLAGIPEARGLSSNPPPRSSSEQVDDMSWLNLPKK